MQDTLGKNQSRNEGVIFYLMLSIFPFYSKENMKYVDIYFDPIMSLLGKW